MPAHAWKIPCHHATMFSLLSQLYILGGVLSLPPAYNMPGTSHEPHSLEALLHKPLNVTRGATVHGVAVRAI